MFNKYRVKQVIESRNTLRGFYNGVVMDIDDPGYKNDGNPASRVRVAVSGLTKGLETEDLPWYAVKQPFNASPNSQASLPPVGSEVIVEFPDNDIYNGLVSYVLVSSPPAL